MNSDQSAKLPLPTEVLDLRFLVSEAAPGFAVLELDTPTNPVRVFLSRAILERLITQANLTAREMT